MYKQLSPSNITTACLRNGPTATSVSQQRHQSTEPSPSSPLNATRISREAAEKELQKIRLPRAVQATYLDPLRHRAVDRHNLPLSCELQMRSYSVRNLEVFADFAMRAAYFLKLVALGPTPLPKITERWTVPRSNFVHKKSQENFERITRRRQIVIRGGHPETVAAWLGFLKKYQYYGIGMKANVFEYSQLEVVKDMDAEAERIKERLGEELDLVGGKRRFMLKREGKVERMMVEEPFKAQWGAYSAMGGAESVPSANKRIDTKVVE